MDDLVYFMFGLVVAGVVLIPIALYAAWRIFRPKATVTAPCLLLTVCAANLGFIAWCVLPWFGYLRW